MERYDICKVQTAVSHGSVGSPCNKSTVLGTAKNFHHGGVRLISFLELTRPLVEEAPHDNRGVIDRGRRHALRHGNLLRHKCRIAEVSWGVLPPQGLLPDQNP